MRNIIDIINDMNSDDTPDDAREKLYFEFMAAAILTESPEDAKLIEDFYAEAEECMELSLLEMGVLQHVERLLTAA